MAILTFLCALVATTVTSALKMASNPDESSPLRKCTNQYAAALDDIMPGLGDHIWSHPLKSVTHSNKSVVLNAGYGTTGTISFHGAFSRLGLRAVHWTAWKDPENAIYHSWGWALNPHTYTFTELTEKQQTKGNYSKEACLKTVRHFDYTYLANWHGINAFSDTPLADLFLDVYLTFPNAKVVLGKREAHDWVRSRLKHHKEIGTVPFQEPCGHIGQLMNFDQEKAAKLFDLHTELVRCVVPKDRLLEVDLFQDPPKRIHGLMDELADFLGRPRAIRKTFRVAANFSGAVGENISDSEYFAAVRADLDNGRDQMWD